MNNKYLANILVALAYYIGGLAGLLIAIPPSNAAAVWPAAGVAFSAVLIGGNRLLPGVFLGALLVQTTSYLDTTTTAALFSSFIIGLISAGGSTLQAWVGVKLVSKIYNSDPKLIIEKNILLFCLLAGPVSCLTSASIGITTLWANNVIALQDITIAWATWWIGDAIGVLVFTPIIMSFFAKPEHHWRSRIKSVALPLCILTITAFIGFEFSNQREMKSVENELARNTDQLFNDISSAIYEHTESAIALKEFIESHGIENITEQSFLDYAKPKIQRHPTIQALEWIPRIKNENRSTFENETGIKITEYSANGSRLNSSEKEIYFPIQFLWPLENNEKALGFDILGNPTVRETLSSICSPTELLVTSGIKLAQEKLSEISVVFYAPVYKTESFSNEITCDSLKGVAASVFRLENEINKLRQRLPNLKLNITIKEQEQGKLIYSDLSKSSTHTAPNKFEFKQSHTLNVANKKWLLEFTPAAGFISHYASWTIWAFIIVGLLITSFSGIGLLMLTGRALRTNDLVKIKTEQLHNEVVKGKVTSNQLALENDLLEMISQEHQIEEIAETITTRFEELFPDMYCSILLLDSGGKHLLHLSAPSLPNKYNEAINGAPIGPNAGSCGTAAYLKEPVIVNNIATDERWKVYKELALKFDLKACWSYPILSAKDNSVIGTFAIYFKEINSEGENIEIQHLLSRLADLIAISINKKKTDEQLSYQATHDSLTGLVNRREFERRIERLIGTISVEKSEHAMCFMDLDQFKIINDTCGHTAGDEMLIQLTKLLHQSVRKRDTLARLGGDEFGILMEHCSLENAYRVANQILEVVQNFRFNSEGRSFKIGVSIGLVIIDENTLSMTELLKQADAACYMAKDLGRNRIHLYHIDDTELAQRHSEMQWVSQIYNALEKDNFKLYGQLISSLSTDKVHYEILIRMYDENLDLVPPGAFLPAAERFNLIDQIDQWVVEKTFEKLKDNQPFLEKISFISINLSGQSLVKDDFLDFVIEQLRVNKIPGNKICFEITETAAINNLNAAKNFIDSLKGLDCYFALDDFGSGLSSFGYLKYLNVDFLKIDGIFVKDIMSDEIDLEMVKSINNIGHVMGLETIAEFVESGEIKNMLKIIGVNYVQGYGIDRPKPLDDIISSTHD